MNAPAHISVLLQEAIDGLNIQPGGIYLDGTFGRGGHSRVVLSQLGPAGRLFAIDRDPSAIAAAAADGNRDITISRVIAHLYGRKKTVHVDVNYLTVFYLLHHDALLLFLLGKRKKMVCF